MLFSLKFSFANFFNHIFWNPLAEMRAISAPDKKYGTQIG